jgi:hypothetical protein
MRGDLADIGITLNETARDEHVGDIERYIRTLKECMHAIYNTLPFTHMPPCLVIEMAKHSVYWLNAFPHPNGISDNVSPRTIITGQTVDFHRHCKYEFGEYVQTHEQHDNSMAPRTIGALALHPTGNAQGNYYFFSLSTGRVINRVHATRLPMPDDVIDRIHALACRQQANPGLVFLDRNRVPEAVDDAPAYDSDDDDDSDFMPDDAHSDSDSDASDYDSSSSDDDDDDQPNLDSVASASNHDSVSEDEFHPDDASGTPGVDSDDNDNDDEPDSGNDADDDVYDDELPVETPGVQEWGTKE